MTGLTFELLCMQLLTGIALGSIYALLALGLCLVFGMLNVVNFAHGAFFMVGAFMGVYFLGITSPHAGHLANKWCRVRQWPFVRRPMENCLAATSAAVVIFHSLD